MRYDGEHFGFTNQGVLGLAFEINIRFAGVRFGPWEFTWWWKENPCW
jgi:hypothetical protein